MAASKELITKIILKAQADSSISKSFSALAKNSETCINKLTKIGDTAKKAFKVVGTAVAAGAYASVKAAIDFESAFAGVQKTVDETDTTSYEDLSNGIRELAKVTPAAATEIAEVAASAGQLGIKADDILSFSKTMIDLGESTNLSSEEAATSIAKLFNVTGTSMSQVSNFGSTLVALGNNAATTESDILAMSSRIAGSGKQIGLTEQQILALATSLSSVGIEAEMGGSAISTTMSQIDKDVAMNTDELSIWAKTAGMSVADFSKAWKTDAYGALQKVMKGMASTKEEGGNLNVLLDELGISGIRQGDTLKRLSSATGLMSEMTDLANKSWSENAALSKEANTRYATTASRLQILRNKLTDAAITIGNAMLPAINKIIDKIDNIDFEAIGQKVAKVITWIVDNFDKVKVALGILAAAFVAFKIGSFVTTIAGAAKEVKMFAQTLQLGTKIKNFGEAISLSKAGFTGLAGTASASGAKIGSALAAIGPWGWIIAAVVLVLVGAFTTLWKTNEKFRKSMTEIWQGIKDKFSSFADGFVSRINELGFNFKNITEVISAAWQWLCKVIAPIFEVTFQTISNVIGVVLDSILGTMDFFIGLFTGDWKQMGEGLKTLFLAPLKLLLAPFKAIISTIEKYTGGGVTNIVNWFKQLPSRIWNWLVQTWQKITTWASNLWTKAKEIGSNFVNGVVNFFKTLPYKIGYCIGFVIGKIIQFGQKLWSFATTTVPQFIGKVIEWFKQLPSKIWTWLKNAVVKIGQWAVQMKEKMRTGASNAIKAVINFFKQLPGKVWTWLKSTIQKIGTWGSNMVAKAKKAASDTASAIVTKIKELPSKMLSIGKNIVEGLWNGLKNAKNWLVDKVKSFGSGIVDGIKGALGIHSPSTVMMKLAKFVPQGFGIGIVKNAKYAVNAIKTMGGKVTTAASKISPTFSSSVGLQKFGTGGTVTSPQAAIVGDRPETIVPHGNTPRNRALLAEAARGVGASSGGNILNFTFAPVINGGNAEDNRAMIRDEEEAFEQRMQAWLEKNRRLAFN